MMNLKILIFTARAPLAAFAVFAALQSSGCVTEESRKVSPSVDLRATTLSNETAGRTAAAPGDVTVTPPTTPGAAAAKRLPDLNELTNSDPCAGNLQTIAGSLLMYYAVNQRLPDQIGDASAFADFDAPLDFRCPRSKLAYVYARDGLRCDGKSKVIIVYDAAASHGGVRWCILMAANGSIANRSLEVVAMPESTFRLYH